MKVRISDIPYEGLKINESLDLTALNERLNLGSESDIVFTSPPQVDIAISRQTEGAEVRGTVRSAYKQACSRCMEPVEQTVQLPTNFILKQRSASPHDAADEIDDLGIVYFDGEHLNVEELIQEALILSLSVYWHPPEDKEGNCTVCGRLWRPGSKEQSGRVGLGELLKKAGLS